MINFFENPFCNAEGVVRMVGLEYQCSVYVVETGICGFISKNVGVTSSLDHPDLVRPRAISDSAQVYLRIGIFLQWPTRGDGQGRCTGRFTGVRVVLFVWLAQPVFSRAKRPRVR